MDVKLSRWSTTERKIYDISHFLLNTKHRNTFRRRNVRVFESTVTRSTKEVRNPPNGGYGIVYFLTPTRAFYRAHRSEDGSHYSGWFMLFGCARRRISRDFVKQNGETFLLYVSLALPFLLPFSRSFSRNATPRYFRQQNRNFIELKPARKTVAVFQRRKVLTFWLFDLQPLLEIQRAAMT